MSLRVNIISFNIRVYSHQPLLSYDSLLDILSRIESLTVFYVSRGDIDGAIFADLIGQLRPRPLRITIVRSKSAPFVVGDQFLVLADEKFLQTLIFKLASFYLVDDLLLKCVPVF